MIMFAPAVIIGFSQLAYLQLFLMHNIYSVHAEDDAHERKGNFYFLSQCEKLKGTSLRIHRLLLLLHCDLMKGKLNAAKFLL